MALEGSIKDFSLADIFQLIGIQRKTGVLTLKSKDEEVKVSFLNGMVVNADSRSKRLDDRLGSVLVKTGKIGSEDLKRGLKIQKDTLKKLGHVLVEEGLVRPEDLREALNIQITQIIYRLFRWKDGDYHFEQDVHVDYDKENFTPMSAESILMEGMRMIDEWPIIERKISSFDMVFEKVALGAESDSLVEESPAEEEGGGGEKTDDFDLIFGGDKARASGEVPTGGKIRLGREENLVYQQVNGTATVQEIVERTMLSEFETCRALYDLMNRNLIAPVASAVAAAAPVAREKRADVSGLLGRLLILPLVAAVIFAVLHQRGNRLNFATPPPLEAPALEPLRGEAARARVSRVAAAVDVFVLLRKGYPSTLDDLVGAGLLRPAEARDPWGRPLGFEVQPDRLVVTSRTGRADDSEMVSESRQFQR